MDQQLRPQPASVGSHGPAAATWATPPPVDPFARSAHSGAAGAQRRSASAHATLQLDAGTARGREAEATRSSGERGGMPTSWAWHEQPLHASASHAARRGAGRIVRRSASAGAWARLTEPLRPQPSAMAWSLARPAADAAGSVDASRGIECLSALRSDHHASSAPHRRVQPELSGRVCAAPALERSNMQREPIVLERPGNVAGGGVAGREYVTGKLGATSAREGTSGRSTAAWRVGTGGGSVRGGGGGGVAHGATAASVSSHLSQSLAGGCGHAGSPAQLRSNVHHSLARAAAAEAGAAPPSPRAAGRRVTPASHPLQVETGLRL
jgi:hypothetical protein